MSTFGPSTSGRPSKGVHVLMTHLGTRKMSITWTGVADNLISSNALGVLSGYGRVRGLKGTHPQAGGANGAHRLEG